MRRLFRAVAAVALVAAMMGADGGCQRQGEVHSDRPASDRKADPKQARTATIKVTEASGPHNIWVRAHKEGEARGDNSREKAAGPGYQQKIEYTSGLRIEITITVTGHPGDIFACEIKDGQNVSRDRGAGQVRCKLTTSR